MKPVLIAVALLSFTATASAQLSPVGCKALAESAEAAFTAVVGTTASMKGGKLDELIPMMPAEAQQAAKQMLQAQQDARPAIQHYADSIYAFSQEMRRCAAQ